MSVDPVHSPPEAVVAVGASAGGVETLMRLAKDLPADLGAAVLVVLHVSAAESRLPQILSRAGPLPASHARDGEELLAGRVYVAPPDRHLVVDDGRLRVVRGPAENRHRPAIDPLFRSVALSFGPRAVAVVLTGSLDDGAAGASTVARNGGTVIVQDPEEAPFPSMPLHAIAADHPGYIVKAETIGKLVSESVEKARAVQRREAGDEDDRRELELAELELGPVGLEAPGERSPFSRPACGGGLWEADDEVLRFRCRVGHPFGADSLIQGQTENLETALWVALRALEERAQLARRLENRMTGRGLAARASHYGRMVEEAERSSRVLRDLLLERDADAV